MPYTDDQDKFDTEFGSPSGIYFNQTNSGELNLVLTKTCIDYFMRNGMRYAQINDIVGALTAAKDEFTRRVVHPYEDMKAKQNGDVYAEVLTALNMKELVIK